VAAQHQSEDEKAIGRRSDSTPRNWALVIGIDGYHHSPLKYCVKDAATLAEALQARCGYAAKRVYLMTDGLKDFKDLPTRRNIVETARLVADLPAQQDTLLFYFSGHGVSVDEKGYLVPIDTTEVVADQLVSIAELRGILRGSKAIRRVMILDACHSGSEKAADDGAMSKSFEDALKADSAGIVTLASCRADETSLEAPWRDQGLFTYWLVQGLSGQADREQAGNKDGKVEITELYQFVYERVRSEAAKERRHRQNPFMLAALSGRIELARVPESASPASGPAPQPSTQPVSPAPPSPADKPKPPADKIEKQGGYLVITVQATGANELEQIQAARQRSRRLFTEYMLDTLKSGLGRDRLLEHARDHEELVDAEQEGDKLRYVVKIPIP
jgi:hypothetical protein